MPARYRDSTPGLSNVCSIGSALTAIFSPSVMLSFSQGLLFAYLPKGVTVIRTALIKKRRVSGHLGLRAGPTSGFLFLSSTVGLAGRGN